MPNQWYVQHNGKQYGPLSGAQLKKLATDGKISSTTSVRLGDAGDWVPAARVQGLFAAAVKSPVAPAAPAPAIDPLSPPPLAAPAPPPRVSPEVPLADPFAQAAAVPMASPLARAPLGRLASSTSPAASPTDSLPAKLLGALALVLGILALATCWLALLGALGWTGIIVGSLGLLLGIAGFIFSALNQAAGLYLNVAGTASSLVGLVLSVVFGVMWGLFGKDSPPVVASVPPPVVVPVREPEPAPPVQEPEPEPEPVWTDASQAIELGPIRARIAGCSIEQVRMENTDLSVLTSRPKARPMLRIRVKLENITSDRIVEAPGWIGGSDLVGQGVGQLLGPEVAKAASAVAPSASLVDQLSNKYKQTPTISLFGARVDPDMALRPGASTDKDLVFDPPLDAVEYLRLELAPAGFGGEEPLRFQIPREMIQGLPAAPNGN